MESKSINNVEEITNNDVGKTITMSDGHSKRVLKKDVKGLYVIKGGIKNYVSYHSNTETYQMTGEWGHK